jgi:integrase
VGNDPTLSLGNDLTLEVGNHVTLELGNHVTLKASTVGNIRGPRQPLFMSKDEFHLLHEHAKDQTMKDIFLWSVMTGCRIAEILQVKWTDIDLASLSIRIRNSDTFATKTGLDGMFKMQ